MSEAYLNAAEDALYKIGYDHGYNGLPPNSYPTTDGYDLGYLDGKGDRELEFLRDNPTLKSEWQDQSSHLKEWYSWTNKKHIPATKGLG